MTIQNLDRQELEKKLEDILNLLEKKGLIPKLSPTEKKDLKKNVADTLINDPKINLTNDDLKNDGLQKALGISCVAELLKLKDPNYKFDYSLLFKKQIEIEPETLQKELKLLFTNALKLNPSYQNKPKNEQLEMEAEINQLVKKMIENPEGLKNSKELLCTNDKEMSFITAGLDLLSEQRRSLYGIDTHTPGAVQKPVLSVPYGEQMGLQDLATTGESFMAKRDEAGPVPDPLGIHFAALINFLADGNTTSYEQYLQNNDIIPGQKHEAPSPFHTKPSPFDEH